VIAERKWKVCELGHEWNAADEGMRDAHVALHQHINAEGFRPRESDGPPIDTGEVNGLDFMSKQVIPAEWLVDGLVEAASVGGLLGQYKAGKSLAGLQLCFAVARGRDQWLGHDVTKGGATIFIEYEGSEARLQERYRLMAAKYGALSGGGPSIIHRPEHKVDTDEGEAWLAAACLGKVLCVIGPVSKAASIQRENEPAEWQALSERLQRVVDATGCTIVLIHHTRKPSQQYGQPRKVDDYFNTARGSNSYMGAVDFALGVQKEQEDAWGTLYYLERDGGSGRLAYDFDIPSLCIWPSDRPLTKPTAADRQAQALAFIVDNPDCTKVDIAAAVGVEVDTVTTYLRGFGERVIQTAAPGQLGRYRVNPEEV
jgi:hypothetical protein